MTRSGTRLARVPADRSSPSRNPRHQYETDEAQDESRAAVERLLRRLDRRERRIIVNRNGIGGVPERTLKQIGVDLGISKERVRHIERRAHAKLRSFARLEGITAFDL